MVRDTDPDGFQWLVLLDRKSYSPQKREPSSFIAFSAYQRKAQGLSCPVLSVTVL